ncbi:MAG: adenosylhomocysteinase [Bacillota bacterium]
MNASTIRDRGLAPAGRLKIDWAAAHMPVLNRLRDEYRRKRPLAGFRVGMCLHLEAKTAYLALVLSDLGAHVTIAGSNPLSTQDDVAAAAAAEGIEVHSWHGATAAEYERFVMKVVDSGPNLIIDDGGDLVTLLHSRRRDLVADVVGGAEETTTGLLRLRAMHDAGELGFPMIAVNDALSKYLFDNRYGTGQSVWDGILRSTNLVVAGKLVVVSGYGWCGKGVVLRARGMGARVLVTEVDPIAANEALMDGCEVTTMDDAASRGDIFITTTGCRDVIRGEHFAAMKDGAILANAGHFDVEVDVEELERMYTSRGVRHSITEYRRPDGARLYLLGEGRLVNLACADGHPAEIMDMSFALQLLALNYLVQTPDLPPGVHRVTDDIDRKVASLRLKALGVRIDELTPRQEEYLNSWLSD